MSKLPVSGQHLSDEQFSRTMAGESMDRNAELHLADCPRCQVEVNAMQGSLAEFNAFSLAWAEREAPRRVRTPLRWTLRLRAHPVWNMAAMTIAVYLALALGLHFPHQVVPAAPAMLMTQTLGAVPSGAELAEDNRLLASIHQELSYTAQPTVPLDELQSSQDRKNGRDDQGDQDRPGRPGHPGLKDAGHHSPAELREAVAN